MIDMMSEKEILDLLKVPIEEECFMIAYSWWQQWESSVNATKDRVCELGAIYNIDLV